MCCKIQNSFSKILDIEGNLIIGIIENVYETHIEFKEYPIVYKYGKWKVADFTKVGCTPCLEHFNVFPEDIELYKKLKTF